MLPLLPPSRMHNGVTAHVAVAEPFSGKHAFSGRAGRLLDVCRLSSVVSRPFSVFQVLRLVFVSFRLLLFSRGREFSTFIQFLLLFSLAVSGCSTPQRPSPVVNGILAARTSRPSVIDYFQLETWILHDSTCFHLFSFHARRHVFDPCPCFLYRRCRARKRM